MIRTSRAVLLSAVGLISAAPLAAQTKVTMYLAFLVNGYHAPFYLAREKGWYKEAGLEVTISPGRGTSDSIKQVGTGNAQFGEPDFGAVSKAVSQGIPITAVAAYVNETPAGVISFADNAVKVPKDLEGKSVSVAPFGATAMFFPVFSKLNNVEMSKVKVVEYNFGAMVPSFLTGKVEATTGYYFGEFLAAHTESKNRKVHFLPYADFGVRTYANGIVVNNNFMAKDPKAVDAFVKTTLRAVRHTISNVDEAIAATAKHTETPAAMLRAQLIFAMRYIDTDEARKVGFGVMTAEKWASTQKLQVEYGGQKETVPDAKLWTNRFLQ